MDVLLYKNEKTYRLPDDKAKKLCKELLAGRGQVEMVELIENGYEEFLGVDGNKYFIESMSSDLLGVKNES